MPIVVEAQRCRRWHVDLANAIAPAGESAAIAVVPGQPLPSCLEMILKLERLIFGLASPRASDACPAQDGTGPSPADVDLTTIGMGDSRSLRILYDGSADEVAIFGALLCGRAPLVQVVGGPDAAVYAEGIPSIETADCLTRAYEHVVVVAARLVRSVVSQGEAAQELRRSRLPHGMDSISTGQIARYATRSLAHSAVKWLYRLCTRAPHWRVGWRYIEGAGAAETGTLRGVPFQNLADPGFRFFADPFPITWKGDAWVFVEDFDHFAQKGVISCIRFDEGGPSGPMRVALDLPWHLSYPFVFTHGSDLWMIPESSGDRTLRLYRADGTLTRWREEAVLLEGIAISDATLHHDGQHYWMFGTVSEEFGAPSDALYIYSADRIQGPWRPHSGNPVLVDAGLARPAGRMITANGRLYRPVQDCESGYGRAIQIAEVTHLTQDRFRQTPVHRLQPGPLWPGRRLHTINRSAALECIDGSAISFRGLPLPWHQHQQPQYA